MTEFFLEFGKTALWVSPFTLLHFCGLSICIRFRKTAHRSAKLGIFAFSIFIAQQFLSSAFKAWFSLSFSGLAPMGKIEAGRLAFHGFIALSIIGAVATTLLLMALYRAFVELAAHSAPNPSFNPDATSASHSPHQTS